MSTEKSPCPPLGLEPSTGAQAFFNAYNAHDVSKMLAMCRKDAQLRYVPMGSQGQGPIGEVGKQIWARSVLSVWHRQGSTGATALRSERWSLRGSK